MDHITIHISLTLFSNYTVLLVGLKDSNDHTLIQLFEPFSRSEIFTLCNAVIERPHWPGSGDFAPLAPLWSPLCLE